MFGISLKLYSDFLPPEMLLVFCVAVHDPGQLLNVVSCFTAVRDSLRQLEITEQCQWET